MLARHVRRCRQRGLVANRRALTVGFVLAPESPTMTLVSPTKSCKGCVAQGGATDRHMQVSKRCSSWKAADGLLETPLGAIKIRLTRLGASRWLCGSTLFPCCYPFRIAPKALDEIPFAIVQMRLHVALPPTITKIRADTRGEPHRPWRRAPFGELRIPSSLIRVGCGGGCFL